VKKSNLREDSLREAGTKKRQQSQTETAAMDCLEQPKYVHSST
jgi:hypothetical protein